MAYDLEAIKKKINDLSGGGSPNKQNRQKLNWFKPQIDNYEIRFLPYEDSNGQPFQEVSYYDNKMLSENRIVAPAQFGLDDPIFDLLNKLREEKTREAWKTINALRPKERFYAPIVIRGEEDKGVRIWELNSKLLKDIYSALAHPDYCDEDLMDPVNGYDFTLTVTDTGKKFNGYAVKDYDIQPRKKPTPLMKNKKDRENILSQIPNLEEYFRGRVRDKEWMNQLVENFLAQKDGDAPAEDEEEGNASARGSNGSAKAKESIEDAFADLDDEEDPF